MEQPKIIKRVLIFLASTAIISLLDIFLDNILPSNNLIDFFNCKIQLKWVILIVLILCLLIGFLVEYIIQYRKCVKFYKPLNNKLKCDFCNMLEGLGVNLYDEDFKYVDSLQLYKYNNFNDKYGSHIQCNFIGGVAKQGYEINAIQQTYFDFPHKLYKKIDKIAEAYRIYKNEEEQRKSLLKKGLKEKIEDVMSDITKELGNLNPADEISEEAYSIYRMYNCYLGLPDFNLDLDLSTINENLKNALNTEKRNNILGAMLLDDLYIFRNENSLNKKNRLYFSFPFLTKKHIIVVGTLNLDIMGENVDIVKVCESISKKILGVKNDK